MIYGIANSLKNSVEHSSDSSKARPSKNNKKDRSTAASSGEQALKSKDLYDESYLAGLVPAGYEDIDFNEEDIAGVGGGKARYSLF